TLAEPVAVGCCFIPSNLVGRAVVGAREVSADRVLFAESAEFGDGYFAGRDRKPVIYLDPVPRRPCPTLELTRWKQYEGLAGRTDVPASFALGLADRQLVVDVHEPLLLAPKSQQPARGAMDPRVRIIAIKLSEPLGQALALREW